MTSPSQLIQIALGVRPNVWRPDIGFTFRTWIDPAFSQEDLDLIPVLLERVSEATNRDVRFAPQDEPDADLRIVLDGARPYDFPYAGLTSVKVRGTTIYGAEVVIHPDYQWARARVVLHELMHVLGMVDTQIKESLTGGADTDQVPEIDREAWRWMAGFTSRPGSFSSVATTVPVCGGVRR